MEEIKYISYSQNEINYLSFSLPFEILNNSSEVLIYGDNPYGYQRAPNDEHINKIKKYIIENIETFKFPTSIILAVDLNEINKIKKGDTLNFSEISNDNKIFRIVDGQHRIRGLEKALSQTNNQKLKKFELNVICIITEQKIRSLELEIFVDINSKGKKVSTDLAELAKYNLLILEEKFPREINRLAEQIAMITSNILNETKDNIWFNAIKFDIHDEITLGIVGVSAFRQSITRNILYLLTQQNFEFINITDLQLVEACKIKAQEIAEFYLKCWNLIIRSKWSTSFIHDTALNDQKKLCDIYYSKKHYIQKAMGVKSLNKIIEDCCLKNHGIYVDSIKEFENIINNSQIKNEHWLSGGLFSGLNSEGGFKKIKDYLMNSIEINS